MTAFIQVPSDVGKLENGQIPPAAITKADHSRSTIGYGRVVALDSSFNLCHLQISKQGGIK